MCFAGGSMNSKLMVHVVDAIVLDTVHRGGLHGCVNHNMCFSNVSYLEIISYYMFNWKNSKQNHTMGCASGATKNKFVQILNIMLVFFTYAKI